MLTSDGTRVADLHLQVTLHLYSAIVTKDALATRSMVHGYSIQEQTLVSFAVLYTGVKSLLVDGGSYP